MTTMEVAVATIGSLLDGALPDPFALASEVGPLVDERRLVGWMARDADQDVLLTSGLSGALPDLDGATDGFSVVINNAGANKLDAFLRSRM